jgi:hypothetical protein
MHPPHVRAAALALIQQGLNDCEVSRRLGIPRRTILDWRRPTYVPRKLAVPRETCPRCWRAAKPMRFTPEDYAELLGIYLGDGCISRGPRTFRLRIALDLRYPKIIEDTRQLLERCFPHNTVDVIRKNLKGRCVNISTYSNHLPCLLPQHGAGPKHDRPIVLEAWQQTIVDTAPWPFVRGLIRTDGCCFVNRTDIHRPQPYEYLSYHFSNKSKDIVNLFTAACEFAGIDDYRLTLDRSRGQWTVRINRRGSVAKLLEHVGLKK